MECGGLKILRNGKKITNALVDYVERCKKKGQIEGSWFRGGRQTLK